MMIISYEDYNNSQQLIQSQYIQEWNELHSILQDIPLCLKPSKQSGKKGTPIFDPVKTNNYIKQGLQRKEWSADVAIPQEYKDLGKAVDSEKQGIIIEVQFSNYPFLLNNLIRAEVFYKNKLCITNSSTTLIIIISKTKIFPTSESTLNFENAKRQLDIIVENQIFTIPVRLVGLFQDTGTEIGCEWTEYSQRTSREIIQESSKQCMINVPAPRKKRHTITII